MSEQYDVQGEQAVDEKRGALKRRGLIAGAAALVAGVLAKQSAEPVVAGTDGDVVAGATTFFGTTTYMILDPHSQTIPAVIGNNFYTGALDNHGDGIQGYTTNPDQAVSNAGVFGRNNDLEGVGVFGEGPNGTGAFGDSASGSGVAGNSDSGTGVYGKSNTGIGVQGISTGGLYGVLGQSGNQPGAAGLIGIATNPNAIAFGSVASGGATIAGYFNGNVIVTGSFGVSGTKSAVVKDVAGDYRLMYCVEAPDSWFEDFGTGTITNGKASVTIDPGFGQFVHLNDYHVFLTEDGGTHHHLSVQDKTSTGCTVGADQEIASLKGKKASDLNGTFSWRLVAKRADVKAERLAKVEIPDLKVKLPKSNLPKPRH
ncbi:MAG: hypothetical protein M3Y58_03135 [Chloroflexota bacterium]|nr:hypothetical protein [Chloroflexota bacterium]